MTYPVWRTSPEIFNCILKRRVQIIEVIGMEADYLDDAKQMPEKILSWSSNLMRAV